jgi:periplasmic copper chaperone A
VSPHHVRRCSPALACALAALAFACARAARGGHAESGDIAVSHAVVSLPPPSTPAPGFLVLENRGSAPDTLLAVDSPDADSVTLHTVVGGQMEPVAMVAVPTYGRVRFAPGGYHLMIGGLHQPLAAGDTVRLALHFARAGRVLVRAVALRYSEAVGEVP